VPEASHQSLDWFIAVDASLAHPGREGHLVVHGRAETTPTKEIGIIDMTSPASSTSIKPACQPLLLFQQVCRRGQACPGRRHLFPTW
jgi:hypothetical protein